MNILFINGSPKKKNSASAFFLKVLSFMLFPQRAILRATGLSGNYENIFNNLQIADVVVMSVPLYVDGIPSHIINFLKQMEQYCHNNKCKFTFYTISNSGFLGGLQNQAHLEQYKCWCARANITWGGGLGIEGGVMLHVVFYVTLIINIVIFIISVFINIVSGEPAINNVLLINLFRGIFIWLFFSSGMLFSIYRMSCAIKKRKAIKTKHTRAMVPSFIFIIFATIFMALTALFHGKMVFSLFKRREYIKDI